MRLKINLVPYDEGVSSISFAFFFRAECFGINFGRRGLMPVGGGASQRAEPTEPPPRGVPAKLVAFRRNLVFP